MNQPTRRLVLGILGIGVVLALLGWWGYRSALATNPAAQPTVAGTARPMITVVDPDPTPVSEPDPQPITAPAAAVEVSEMSEWSVPILMYHYVRTVDPAQDKLGFGLSVTKEQFASQLDYLATHGFHVIDPTVLTMNPAPLPSKPIILTFDDGYEDFYTTAWPMLRAHQMTAVAYVVTGFLDRDRYLTTAQLKELASQGAIIGAHTVHHADLAKQDPAALRAELTESKATLEALIGRPVPWIAYPAGRYNADVLAATKAAGYLQGVTTKPGFATSAQDPLQLTRIRISGGDSLEAFAQKVEGHR